MLTVSDWMDLTQTKLLFFSTKRDWLSVAGLSTHTGKLIYKHTHKQSMHTTSAVRSLDNILTTPYHVMFSFMSYICRIFVRISSHWPLLYVIVLDSMGFFKFVHRAIRIRCYSFDHRWWTACEWKIETANTMCISNHFEICWINFIRKMTKNLIEFYSSAISVQLQIYMRTHSYIYTQYPSYIKFCIARLQSDRCVKFSFWMLYSHLNNLFLIGSTIFESACSTLNICCSII